MTSSRSDRPLRDVLARSQSAGAIGPVSIDEVLDHSRLFVRALDGVRGRVVDIGSGGGVPGLVIAWDRADLLVDLVDRRSKRTDLLRLACTALEFGERVRVVTGDVSEAEDGADAVVARLFGSPEVTARAAARMVRPGGAVIVSDLPGPDRWAPTAVGTWDRTSLSDGAGTVVRFIAP